MGSVLIRDASLGSVSAITVEEAVHTKAAATKAIGLAVRMKYLTQSARYKKPLN